MDLFTRYPKFTTAEFAELHTLYKSCPEKYQDIKLKLFLSQLCYLPRIISKYVSIGNSLWEDLFIAGAARMWKAFDSYDASRGNNFYSFIKLNLTRAIYSEYFRHRYKSVGGFCEDWMRGRDDMPEVVQIEPKDVKELCIDHNLPSDGIESTDLYEYLLSGLNEKDRNIADDWMLGYTHKQLSKKYNLERTAAEKKIGWIARCVKGKAEEINILSERQKSTKLVYDCYFRDGGPRSWYNKLAKDINTH